MTDISDQATAREEQERELALAAQARHGVMCFTGECYNCAEPIECGCFCDVDCRDDFEQRLKTKRISGHE